MKTLRSCSINWTNLRFIVFLAFIICSQFLNAQVNVKIDNQPIRSILKTIEKNSDFTFFFNEGLPELDKNASLDVSDVTAEIAVKQLLQGTNIAYAIEGKTIILTAKEKLESTRASSTTSSRQSVQRSNVTGIVTDETGEPLIGVSVVVKGTTTGVITNIDGRYSLNNVPVSGTLVFSYVGMKQMEVSVESRSRIDVIMSMESKIIDELVVIGYGTVKKRDLTGSVSSVKTDNINMNSTISIGQALKGKAAGLTIVQNSAQPGGGLDILVRGGSGGSAYTDDTPLYVVDGVPISTLDQPGSNNERLDAGTQGVLNFINPNDIASIEVLKDASATAIYGARAAAGVILITTKRGETGKPVVNYSTSFAIQKHSNIFDVFKLKEWMEERNTSTWDYWMFENDVIPYGNRTLEQAMASPRNGVAYKLPYSDTQIAEAGEGTDWVDLVTRDGSIQQHSLGIQGGTEFTKYMVSLNYYDHKGIIKNSEVKRYSGRINLDQTINDIFKTGVNLTLSRMDNDNTPLGEEQYEKSGLIRAAVQMGPHIQAVDEDGNYPINPLLPTQPNPYSLLTVTDKGKMDRLLANIFLLIEPIENLMFRLNVGTDLAYQKRSTYMPKTTLHGNLAGGLASLNQTSNQSYLADINGTYTFDIADIHKFIVMAGASAEKMLGDGHNLGNNQFLTDGFKWYNLQSGEGTKVVGSWGYENKVRSFFSRVNYTLLDRYLFTATFRADGASVFAKNHKWAYFPSVALAWNMADESFMEFAKPALDLLKLRISYGETGNSSIGSNAFAAYYAASAWNDFNKNPLTGVFNDRLGNPNLKWETTSVYNAGIDVSFFNSKINVVLDYFRRVTSDLLDMKALNSYHDISFVMDNIGKMQGSGIEFTLNTKNITRRNFTWQTDFTFSQFINKWLERAPDWKPTVYQNVDDPTAAYYSRIAIGILQTGETPPASQPDLKPGQLIIEDINGYKRDLNGDPVVENGRFVLTGEPDGIIDDADTKLMGTLDPGPVVGLNNRFTFGNFDFSFDINGMFKRRMMDPTYMAYGASADGIAQYGYNGLRIVKNRWMPDKPSTTIPSSFYGWSRYGYGDWFYQDAWYLRLQSISLGYNLPIGNNLRKVFSSIRFFADANNLFVLTPYTGLDPETDSYAAAYPNARTYTIGIDVKF
jgi:TonB-linked SusC/RagA family outer membrane protein